MGSAKENPSGLSRQPQDCDRKHAFSQGQIAAVGLSPNQSGSQSVIFADLKLEGPKVSPWSAKLNSVETNRVSETQSIRNGQHFEDD
jgi:hypothetical protein